MGAVADFCAKAGLIGRRAGGVLKFVLTLLMATGLNAGFADQTVDVVGARIPKEAPEPIPNDQLDLLSSNSLGTVIKQAPARFQSNAAVNPKTESCTDNPVIISTGEKFLEEADFTASGLAGLTLKRTYRSFGAGTQMFGTNWFPSLVYPQLQFILPQYPWGSKQVPSAVVFTLPDGTQYRYLLPAEFSGEGTTVFYGNTNYIDSGTLRRTSTNWTLKRNGLTYAFSTLGFLQTVTNSGGTVLLTYTYDANYQVTRVTNVAGQYVSFAYANYKVSQATDTAGGVWLYGYDANGMLSSATSPGPGPTTRTYHYEVAGKPALLTGFSVNGERRTNYSYYANSKVQQSVRVGGEAGESFVYRTGETDVTTMTGQTTTHRFATVNGRLAPIGQTRLPTASCPLASAETHYGPSGYIDYRI